MTILRQSLESWSENVGEHVEIAAVASDLSRLADVTALTFARELPADGSWTRLFARAPEMIMQLRGDEPQSQVLGRHGLSLIRPLRWARRLLWVRTEIPTDLELQESKLTAVSADSAVEWVEWNEYDLSQSRSVGCRQPAIDYLLDDNWYWDYLAKEAAWDGGFLGDGSIVTVVDTDFQPTHEAIKSAVLDDRCAVFGPSNAPFSSGQSAVAGHASSGGKSHGTACAGMVAANPKSTNQPAGVAPCSRLGLLALDTTTLQSQLSLARALAFAADPGVEGVPSRGPCDALSCSVGPVAWRRKLSRTLRSALAFCEATARSTPRARGPLLFFASPRELTANLAVDELLSHRAVVPVGSLGRLNGSIAKKFGGLGVRLLAPGEKCYSLTAEPSTNIGEHGTSVSTPLVAGAAALLRSEFPNATAEQILSALLRGARPMPKQAKQPDREHGYGRLDVEGARRLL